ncbi:MAG: ATP-dependent DNA helicase RecG, partial [Clostridia bacterium]|nr:ATP-dependent DNA helicase RecG [Clostridia bacterium]
TAVWFNQPYVAQKLKAGEYLFYGRVQNKYDVLSVTNPTFEPLEGNTRLKGIVPVYSVKGSLTQRIVSNAVKEALHKENIDSVIPYPLQQKYNLSSLPKAYYNVHFPPTMPEQKGAAERIAIEEYFKLISAFKIIKGDKQEARTRQYSVSAKDVKNFSVRFAFEFTDGQKQAVNDIFTSLRSPHRMNRLLQGDVGSGKTAVALCGIYMALKSGYRAAYLSPTEVLAAQNYQTLLKYFPDYKVGYLSGALTAKEKRDVKTALKNGEIDVICGTHAIIQKDVELSDLAFCVCDEQHRFGVAQRNALTEKGESTDMLVMSATPIPRTLSLIFYGDLDVTTVHDKPKEQQPVSTSIIPPSRYADMLEYVERQVKEGKQAYFVAAKIEDDEGEVLSVNELYEDLKHRLPRVRFEMLHGKMKDKQKNAVMQDFKDKKFDCLVSTTVIEVGVDVPSATVMVIHNAERFGLSQLHQLRGRVGRGTEKSYCFLLMGSESEVARERLQILKNSTDGFQIAEEDLRLRGSGDFFGTRQSGKFLNEIRNLQYPTEVIFTAKKLCDESFSGNFDTEQIRKVAIKKYNALKDVVLN